MQIYLFFAPFNWINHFNAGIILLHYPCKAIITALYHNKDKCYNDQFEITTFFPQMFLVNLISGESDTWRKLERGSHSPTPSCFLLSLYKSLSYSFFFFFAHKCSPKIIWQFHRSWSLAQKSVNTENLKVTFRQFNEKPLKNQNSK